MKTGYNNLKNQKFPSYSIDDWELKAKESLKNKPVDSLDRETYEKIKLKPLYTQEDLEFLHVDQYPGSETKARGFSSLENQHKGWAISQRIYKHNWEEVKSLLLSAVQHGQNSISFDVDSTDNTQDICFKNIALNFTNCPFFLITKKHFQLLVDNVLKISDKNPSGVIATDIISREISNGKIMIENLQKMNAWAAVLNLAHQKMPNIKTILIDTTPYHNGGANAVQELAIALAEAVYYIESMKAHNWQPEQTAQKLVFHFAVGGNFFMEIAKLRAFRILWTTIEEAYKLSSPQEITVSAETSSFTKSSIDPYVNMLRAGNEALAAILGGVHFLHVSSYDEVFKENSDFSARIARNTQLILREETQLDKVIDPAGGSYYIETLTKDLVDNAWEFFQKIDTLGGIVDVLKSGWIQNEINEILNRRLLEAETRKQSVVGANVYVSLKEEIPNTNALKLEKEMNIIPISPVRLSQSFEKLRIRASSIESKGKILTAGLICLGSLKDYKQRSDFVSGVLATGGIKTVLSHPCNGIEDVKAFIQKTRYPYYCICGTNEVYNQYAREIGEWMKLNHANIKLDIAGKFSAEELKNFGLCGTDNSIYLHQNLIGKITSLLNLWEV